MSETATPITHKSGEDITCPCGNTPESDGFYACDGDGNEMEPTLNSDWEDLYVCGRCGQIHRIA